jgi:basic amino acid/polyamine antiporter, APA family
LGLPPILTNGPFSAEPGLVNLPALMIILILMFMLIIGIKESVRLNAAMVFIKLLTITVFIAVALFHVNPENWTPFMPFGWFSHSETGSPIGVLAGASVVFFAYVGFDAVSTAVEESRNPKRDIPIGILASLIFCTVIYIIVSALLTGMVHYSELNVSFPVSFALERVGVTWASALVATGVITGLTTVMLVLYYGLTRIIFAMSRDGLMPPFFGKVNSKTQTPVRSTVMCGVLMAIMAGFIPLGALAELVNIGTLAAFVLVCIGVIVLRYTHPDMPRPFKMPWGPVLPIMGVLSCGSLIAFLPSETHWRFILWLAAGLVIYFAYGIRKSTLQQ